MKLKNMYLYNYVIVYAENCDLYIRKQQEEVLIAHKQMAILEKNISFDVNLIRKNTGTLYQSFELDNKTLNSLKKIYEPLVHLSIDNFTSKRSLKDKIFKINPCSVSIEIFKRINNGGHFDLLKLYKLAYLVSKCEDIVKFTLSLCGNVIVSLKEKITKLIFNDISKKWRLSDIADEMHVSEISIRKRLDLESINFNQLVLDARMNLAIKLLLKNDKQVTDISNYLGYSSVSYFIKIFKNYYGITPKQFEIGLKKNFLFNKT